MTTIAITSTHVAADGMRTWGDQIRGRSHRKIRVEGGTIYAFAGLAPMLDVMVRWHRDGADPNKMPYGAADKDHGGWTLVVIDRDGVAKYTNSCPYIERFEPPIAFGAGQDYALGAMLHGASAEEAVRIVGELTNHTGGDIQVIDIAEALGLNQQREAAE